jgi:hypothetical protein
VPTGLKGANEPDMTGYSLRDGRLSGGETYRTAGAGGPVPGVISSAQLKEGVPVIQAARTDAHSYGTTNGLRLLSAASVYVAGSGPRIAFYLLQSTYEMKDGQCRVPALGRTYDFRTGELVEQQVRSTTVYPGRLESDKCNVEDTSPAYELVATETSANSVTSSASSAHQASEQLRSAAVGSWAGSVTGDSSAYNVEAVIRQGAAGLSAEVEYPELQCKASWKETSVSGSTVSLEESLISGRCQDNVKVTLTGDGETLTAIFDGGSGERIKSVLRSTNSKGS